MNREELARLFGMTAAEAEEFLTPGAMEAIQVNETPAPPASPLSVAAQWAEYEASRRPSAYGANVQNYAIQDTIASLLVSEQMERIHRQFEEQIAAGLSTLPTVAFDTETAPLGGGSLPFFSDEIPAWPGTSGRPRRNKKGRVLEPKPAKPAPRPFGESPRRVLL